MMYLVVPVLSSASTLVGTVPVLKELAGSGLQGWEG